MARQTPQLSQADVSAGPSRVPRPARWWRWLAYGGLALMVITATVPYKVGVGDTFIQIRTGQYILEQGIPHSDPFSYMSPYAGHGYVEHEWLGCILFYLLYHWFGAAGLVLYKLVCVGLTCLLVFWTARRLGAREGALVLVGAVALTVMLGRVVTRPHLVSAVFLSGYLWLLTEVQAGAWRPMTLWWLVPAHGLWAQLHGGHIVALAILGMHAGVETLSWWQTRPVTGGLRRLPTRLWAVWALPAACLGAACCGPYGIELLVYPFREATLEKSLDWNGEWLPLYRGGYFSPSVWLCLPLLAGLWWTEGTHWRSGLRRLALGGWTFAFLLSLIPPGHASMGLVHPVHAGQRMLQGVLWSLLGVWVVGAFRTRARWHHAALTTLAMALAINYTRALTELVPVVVTPLLARNLTERVQQGLTAVAHRHRAAAARAWERRLLGRGVLVMVLVTVLAWATRATLPLARGEQERTVGYGLNVPPAVVCATRFLQEHGLHGRLFSNYGAWFVFALWPAVTVGSDTRLHVFNPALLEMGVQALQAAEPLDRYLRRFHPDLLVFRHLEPAWEVYALLAAQGWVRGHLNDGLVVFLAPAAAQAAGLSTHGYRYITPWDNVPFTAGQAAAVLAEADRALEACPEVSTFAWAYKAEALRLLGRHAESFSARLRVPERLEIE